MKRTMAGLLLAVTSKKRPWDYYFFIDVSGHYNDPAMKDALAELQKFCPLVKWLGSYPAAS